MPYLSDNTRASRQHRRERVPFAKDGTLYAATQCHGLAICKPTKDYQTHQLVYRKWRTLTSRFVNHPQLTPMGHGLPTNLLNDVMVARDGTVWVATDEGLAWSRDRGRSWRFVRGRDWEAKDKGLYHGPSNKQVQQIANHFRGQTHLLLSEDYVTCIGEDSHGYIWVGHWRKGIEVLDPKTGKMYHSNGKPISAPKRPHSGTAGAPSTTKTGLRDYVSKILTRSDTSPVVGFYGGGIVQTPQPFGVASRANNAYNVPIAQRGAARHSSVPTLPASAAAPTRAVLQSLLPSLRLGTRQAARIRYPYATFWATIG